ncbi:MAG: HAD-IC family P-type ATPase [Patescibacteria group bacterium]|nr:HAD-IC family P-type ATPase [Patescibacteria group bacterium]
MANFFWHNLKIKEIEKILRTNIVKGLDEKDVKLRQLEFGKNKLPEEKPLSRLAIFLEQFKSPLAYILVIAGFVVLLLKEFTDAVVIFGAVFLNIIIGYFQEHKASQALAKLKKMVEHHAEVLREGNLKILNLEELVPGDVVVLNPGDIVPADGRIIESNALKINEMALTGEWLSAEKKQEVMPKETPLADRDNMVYMGTIVEDGKAKVLIVETGAQTEIGKIAEMIRETKEEKTPYQKKLASFSKVVGVVIALICVFIFIEGIIKGFDFIEMFITAVAVAVAAIPEGLPAAMTVVLALGMQKILKKGGLVRKLSSAETLGSTSIICTDKTATLTEGKMVVSDVLTVNQILQKDQSKKTEFFPLKIASFTSEAFIENSKSPKEEWIFRGRPTDKALLKAGIEKGIKAYGLNFRKSKIAEIPFNPINKFVGAVIQKKDGRFLYVSGAPERVLDRSQYIELKGKKLKLTEKRLETINEQLEKLTGAGLRIVASSYRKIKNIDSMTENLEKEVHSLIFTGFVTIKDPLRKDVKEAIRVCKQAGIKTIIITGDHKLTAKAVARELGFPTKEENILEGKELDKLTDEKFKEVLKKIRIYARVEPKHKTRIVEAWQEQGEVVAMTGDGINDAPALKKADIGIAIGSGTEVAKETSDMVLLNNSFSVIVKAVEEGRLILDNIRKVITYLLSDSFTEVILIGFSIFLNFPLPITAVQILWVNLIEDGLPGISLAFEPKEKHLMKRKSHGHNAPLLTKEMKVLIFIIGLITDILLLGLFLWLIKYSGYEIPHIRSIIFAGLTIDSLFYVFSCKSLRRNLWHINPFSNKFLVFAWIFGIAMLLLALYLPFLQILLKTVPLNLFDWQIILGLGALNVTLIEATKWYFITKKQYD